MTLENIYINAAIADAEKLLKDDKQITPPARAVMSVLLLVIKLLMAKSGMNSRNSSIPPSPDQAKRWRARYRKVVGRGNTECPAPVADGQGSAEDLRLLPLQ